ncbi:hypothetical protein BaRGS_00015045 [Batillaria attramentaria]|uniref:PWWP domain-containing protein n=1 Tax=Batillaria attramentaria TaxID=370345 RepID=A0ABD0L396_9CAEN
MESKKKISKKNFSVPTVRKLVEASDEIKANGDTPIKKEIQEGKETDTARSTKKSKPRTTEKSSVRKNQRPLSDAEYREIFDAVLQQISLSSVAEEENDEGIPEKTPCDTSDDIYAASTQDDPPEKSPEGQGNDSVSCGNETEADKRCPGDDGAVADDQEHSRYNSCEKEEQEYDESDHIFTRYTLGSLVWVKMDGYPWWPGMIDIDPDYDIYCEVPSEESMYPPYLRGHKFRKGVSAAMRKAREAFSIPLQERLQKFGFAMSSKNLRGRQPAKQAREITGTCKPKPSPGSSGDDSKSDALFCTGYFPDSDPSNSSDRDFDNLHVKFQNQHCKVHKLAKSAKRKTQCCEIYSDEESSIDSESSADDASDGEEKKTKKRCAETSSSKLCTEKEKTDEEGIADRSQKCKEVCNQDFKKKKKGF